MEQQQASDGLPDDHRKSGGTTHGVARDALGMLDQLSRIGAQAAAQRTPEAVVQCVTDEATALVGAQFGAFFYNVVADSGESYMLYTLSGVPREAFSKFPMPRNTAVFAPTFAGEGVVRSDDITKDPRYGKNAPNEGMPEGHLPVRSYLAVPVKSLDGEVLGGLFFGHAEPGVFDITAERALAALAPIAGTALTNARLFASLTKSDLALRESEKRYRLVVEATQEGVWFWDVATNTVTWNDRLLELMGVSRAEWGGSFDDWFARLHPEDQPRLAGALKAHLEERVPYRIDLFRLRHASGEYRWCATTGQAEWDEDGRPLRMAGSFRDITDKKLAEDAVQASQDRRRREADTQRLLAHASAILGSSIDYGMTLANVARATVPAFADWAAVDVLDEHGRLQRLAVEHPDPAKVQLVKDLEEKYPTDMDAEVGVPNVLRTGRPEMMEHVPRDLLLAAAKDDEHREIILSLGLESYVCAPLLVGGRPIGAITFVTAESKRQYTKQDLVFAEELARRASAAIENAQLHRKLKELAASLERRVEQRTAALVEANKELESFSYTVSHDLRAPIRHIGGFVDLLRASSGATLDAKGTRYLDTIKTAATQMGALIDGLLAFSRLGRTELAKRPVDLGDVVRGIVRELEPDLAERNVSWSIGELPIVQGDPTMLRLVLANFVNNAVKYTRPREKAQIEIGSKHDGTEHVVWVKDDGVGFNMEYVNKLFGVFQRLHADVQFEGTGIGLATARRVIHRHGGRTWAEGAVDGGATFFFSLPIEETSS